MEIFSIESFYGAMERCNRHANYQVAIIFRDKDQLSKYARGVRESFADNEYGIESISRSGTMRFANGSVIRPYSVDVERRKRVCVNEIILQEENIDASRFLRLEIYHCGKETERDEVSLDDFLGSFKIY